MICNYLLEQPVVRVFTAPFDVILSNFDVVEPDLLFLTNQRLGEITTSPWVKGTPELVVEIGSPSTRKRDATIKRRLYEREGVSEYWIIDPDLDVIRVYRRGASRFDRPIALSRDAGDVLTTPLLPGLQLRLADV